MGKHNFEEVRLISLSEPFMSFSSPATLMSLVTGDPREILNVRLYVFVVDAEDGAA